jgi:predicted Rossmann-fold nucleotide-binding protein
MAELDGIDRVRVCCGSGPGAGRAYTEAAHRLGCVIAQRGLTLVYGGPLGLIAAAEQDARFGRCA